ncbi:MAG: metal ABC transporter permease, partial [Fibrobacteraceae bacterium]|nr:metal ABC transporter permease [Fibrobacteraceae bacterium]
IAESYTKSLRSMMIFASLISLVLVVLGLFLSYQFNLVTGPVIIVLGGISYLIHLALKRIYRK